MDKDERELRERQFQEYLKYWKDVAVPVPIPLEYTAPSYDQRLRGLVATLRDPQMRYNFNMINRKKPMFNENEVEFIEETAKKDLEVLKRKIDMVVTEMARYGKNLADLKVVESKLVSILEAIKDSKEEDNNCNRRCC